MLVYSRVQKQFDRGPFFVPARSRHFLPAGADPPEKRPLPLLLPVVPRAHLQGEGSLPGAKLRASGTRSVPGAAERDPPRGLRPYL